MYSCLPFENPAFSYGGLVGLHTTSPKVNVVPVNFTMAPSQPNTSFNDIHLLAIGRYSLPRHKHNYAKDYK